MSPFFEIGQLVTVLFFFCFVVFFPLIGLIEKIMYHLYIETTPIATHAYLKHFINNSKTKFQFMSKYLVLSSMLFLIGLLGLFLSRQTHLIIILMALEIILLSANINFIVFSIYFDDILGQIYSLLILTIGAVESAIGLAILIVYYRLRGSIAVDMIYTLKG